MTKTIAIHDADGGTYPNLALLKIAAWHFAQGDTVERFSAIFRTDYDLVYSSKVFSWTPEDRFLPGDRVKRGGTGYGLLSALPDEIEHICPAYRFANMDHSMGFLTRGCSRSCPWCIVPQKEGAIRPHADITEFARHNRVRLMDNNILACTENDYGVQQIEKIAALNLKVDFNQGLDARLIDAPIARRLARLRWWYPLRLACDSKSQMPEVERAVKLLRAAGVKPVRYFCYVLVHELEDALERVEFLRSLNVTPFAQPFRAIGSKEEPAAELRQFARFVNLVPVFKSTSWQEYQDGYKYARDKRLADNGSLPLLAN